MISGIIVWAAWESERGGHSSHWPAPYREQDVSVARVVHHVQHVVAAAPRRSPAAGRASAAESRTQIFILSLTMSAMVQRWTRFTRKGTRDSYRHGRCHRLCGRCRWPGWHGGLLGATRSMVAARPDRCHQKGGQRLVPVASIASDEQRSANGKKVTV